MEGVLRAGLVSYLWPQHETCDHLSIPVKCLNFLIQGIKSLGCSPSEFLPNKQTIFINSTLLISDEKVYDYGENSKAQALCSIEQCCFIITDGFPPLCYFYKNRCSQVHTLTSEATQRKRSVCVCGVCSRAHAHVCKYVHFPVGHQTLLQTIILLFYPLNVNLLPGKELKKFLKMISDYVPFANYP